MSSPKMGEAKGTISRVSTGNEPSWERLVWRPGMLDGQPHQTPLFVEYAHAMPSGRDGAHDLVTRLLAPVSFPAVQLPCHDDRR